MFGVRVPESTLLPAARQSRANNLRYDTKLTTFRIIETTLRYIEYRNNKKNVEKKTTKN